MNRPVFALLLMIPMTLYAQIPTRPAVEVATVKEIPAPETATSAISIAMEPTAMIRKSLRAVVFHQDCRWDGSLPKHSIFQCRRTVSSLSETLRY
jgi:hypothetical protein